MSEFSSHRHGSARGMASRGGRSLRAGIAMILLIPQFTGCYHYVPTATAGMTPGTMVSVGITDQGRVALTEPVGPSVRRLGGRVVAIDDSTLVLAVNTVDYLDVEVPVRWSGERVAVSRQHIAEVQERRLSKKRSLLMAAVAVVGVALLSTLAITGFGSDAEDGGGGDNNNQ